MTVVFSKPEKRTLWEDTLNELKQKLAASLDRQPIPEFISSIPIRKTRAGLQFTCAAPTIGPQHGVWVCNSDGFVGQICVMSIVPEPAVSCCNGVCNARIMCITSVPSIPLECLPPGFLEERQRKEEAKAEALVKQQTKAELGKLQAKT